MGKRIRAWISGAAAGAAALGAISVLGPWLGFALQINVVSLGTSLLLGIPGVVLLLALRAVFAMGG